MSIDNVFIDAGAGPAPINLAAELPTLGLRHPGAESHFRRNHFSPPPVDPDMWALALGGAMSEAMVIPAVSLRTFEHRTLPVVLECAGHRRAEIHPPARGLQWGTGAVSEAAWTGVSLGDVLRRAGIAPDVVEVVLRGADSGAGEHPGVHAYARSLPIEKALHPDTLLAFEMNGEPIPVAYGGPVRAIVPGWYAMDSVKWLTSIRAVTRPFTGPFQAVDYRWREPGVHGPGTRIDRLSVHALITSPASDESLRAGPAVIRGAAWAGEAHVARVEVCVDDGPWEVAEIERRGIYARALWRHEVELAPGVRRLAVRATDRRGATQPERPVPNAGGYCANAVHRVSVAVEEG
jgi:DMSO/TMAO reductase YedYZ molybdopterin-dependent catalytic subunit